MDPWRLTCALLSRCLERDFKVFGRTDVAGISRNGKTLEVRTARVADLKRIIDKTRFAISTEETRYYLNGIYVHVSDEAQPVLKAA